VGDRADPARDHLTLTVVVPVYNEGENFREWWRRASPHLPPGTVVRPVYDMPDDDTLPVIEALRREGAPVEPVKNVGRGVLKALVTGLRSAERGPVLVSMADLSDDLTVLPRMLEAWREGAAVVVASRYMKGGRHVGGPFLKKTISRLGGLSLHLLAGFPAHDATNNFRLYDAEWLRTVDIESQAGFELALELTVKAWEAGRLVVEVPTTWTDRVAGESRFALRKWLPHYARLWARAMKHGTKRRLGG
jgi:dolichol-phosphate mannosyltransferase